MKGSFTVRYHEANTRRLRMPGWYLVPFDFVWSLPQFNAPYTSFKKIGTAEYIQWVYMNFPLTCHKSFAFAYVS